MLAYGLSFSLLLIVLYGWQDVLRYERSLILDGDYWRLLSAHFVHLNFIHLALNLIGWWVFLLLCGHLFSLPQISFNILMLAVGISLGLLFMQPKFQWYLGFSGVLYGLLLHGSLQIAFREQLSLGLLLFSILILKLVLDSYTDQANASAQLIGAPIATVAHAYGLMMGFLLSLPLLARQLSFKKNRTKNN